MQIVNQARYQRCGQAMERVAEIAPSGSEPGLVAFPFRIAAQPQARWSGWQWEILDTRVSTQTARIWPPGRESEMEGFIMKRNGPPLTPPSLSAPALRKPNTALKLRRASRPRLILATGGRRSCSAHCLPPRSAG